MLVLVAVILISATRNIRIETYITKNLGEVYRRGSPVFIITLTNFKVRFSSLSEWFELT